MAVAQPATLGVDEDAILAIASRLDLREPNVEAVRAIAYTRRRSTTRSRAAAAVRVRRRRRDRRRQDLRARGGDRVLRGARASRNFAVVTPGRTILEKTIANFTPGHPKSLLGGMDVEPLVVTPRTSRRATQRRWRTDRSSCSSSPSSRSSSRRPSTAARRTSSTRGSATPSTRTCRSGTTSSSSPTSTTSTTGRRSRPRSATSSRRSLVGLTATPHPKTPREQIIYRYPLAAAIADQLVKTPVIVGRRDDRKDERTKLADGIRLLEAKRVAVERYVRR